MRILLMDALSNYHRKNGCSVRDIILLQRSNYYERSSTIFEFFIRPILRDFDEAFGKDKRPSLIIIHVRTRIYDRFFHDSYGTLHNPPIGTLIGNTVTDGSNDFFLVAHTHRGVSGCIVPDNYKIIYSDSDLEDGLLYSILLCQCFSYANTQGSIKIPSMVQYATKCTKFNNKVLDSMPVPKKFENTLYYI